MNLKGRVLGILGAGSLGALLGGLASVRLRPRYPLRVELLVSLLYVLAPTTLAVPASSAGRMVAFAATQASIEILMVLWATTMQREISPSMLSRASAYDSAVSFCLEPIGYAIGAPLSVLLGVVGALEFAAAASVALALAPLLVRSVRDFQWSPVSDQEV